MAVFNKHLELKGIADIKDFFIKKGILSEYKRNDFYVRQGEAHNHVGFILKGGFRYLGYTSDGKDQIVGYSFENDFVVDYGSFQIKKISTVDAQAIKDSTVLNLTHNELNIFYDYFHNKNLRAELAETLLEDIYSRLVSLYCDSPKERYLKLIERYPEILNLVSLREIASFIKITPETLSRIRKNVIHE